MRYAVSIALIVVDLALIAWLSGRLQPGAGALLLATLAAIVASALVERWRFGRGGGSLRTRLDPIVVIASLVAFDVVYLGVGALRAG